MMRLLDQLTEQRDAKVSGQLYEWTQITMAYNSNRIEGSTLSLMQAQVLYTENKVSGSSDLDDFIEMRNHFRLFDYMLDTADAPLSHELIKEYHRLLKTGTSQERLSWFAVGEYKRLDNVIGAAVTTTPAEEVSQRMEELLERYGQSE